MAMFIADNVVVPASCMLGQNIVIEEGAVIGEKAEICHGSVICAGTIIGDGFSVEVNAVMGKQPASAKTSRRKTILQGPLDIGNGTRIGA